MGEVRSKRIAITGADGFIGRYVLNRLHREQGLQVVPIGRSAFSQPTLTDRLRDVSVVIHAAGMNRGDADLVEKENPAMAERLISALDLANVQPRLLYTSSIQERFDNSYGRGKLRARTVLCDWGRGRGVSVCTQVLPNVFGQGCRPFYNSVVATFCHQLAKGEIPKLIEDRAVPLVHVDRVVEQLVKDALSPENPPKEREILPDRQILVSDLLRLLTGLLDAIRREGCLPALQDRFEINLYHTLRSYLPQAELERRPPPKCDARGSLFEVVKQLGGGQVFFSTTNAGVVRGNHYHTRKIERFCVISGEAIIRMRRIGTDEVVEFPVSGTTPSTVEMPVWFTHHIQNCGPGELLTLFWCNEVFDPSDPDTFSEDVILAPNAAVVGAANMESR